MKYALDPGEGLAMGLKRVANGQLDRAVVALLADDVDDVRAVHEARKCLKKVRAILRLLVDEIDEETYRNDIAAFRGIGADLSGIRDAAVVVDAFVSYCAPQLEPADAARLRELLDSSPAGSHGDASMRERSAARIRLERWRVDEWAIDRRDARSISRGLRRAFKKVRTAYAAVLDNHSDDSLHDWRKKVKVVWYHSRLLQSRDAVGTRRDVVELSQLSELLGIDRDLVLVSGLLREHSTGDPAAALSIAHIGEIRGELQSQAKSLGARLFEQRPRDYAARLLERFAAASSANVNGAHSSRH